MKVKEILEKKGMYQYIWPDWATKAILNHSERIWQVYQEEGHIFSHEKFTDGSGDLLIEVVKLKNNKNWLFFNFFKQD